MSLGGQDQKRASGLGMADLRSLHSSFAMDAPASPMRTNYSCDTIPPPQNQAGRSHSPEPPDAVTSAQFDVHAYDEQAQSQQAVAPALSQPSASGSSRGVSRAASAWDGTISRRIALVRASEHLAVVSRCLKPLG